MRAVSKTMISLNVITDVAVVAYLGISRWLISLDQQPLPSPSHELNSWATAAVSALAFVWIASRMWEQISAKVKASRIEIAEEKADTKSLKEIISEYRFDLVERRAKVDLKIEKLNWALESLLKRMATYDSRERKNLRKLEHLDTRISPWLKEFEPNGTRSVSSAFTEIYSDETTDDGN